jgi:phosphatidate cytidylyltransferase
MALDMQSFKPRFFSAIIFGALMLLGLLGDKFFYISLFTIVVFIGSKEFYNISQKINTKAIVETTQLIYSMACVALFLFVAHATGFNFVENITLQPIIYFSSFILLFFFAMVMHGFKNNFFNLFLGCIYVPLSLGLLAQCYAINNYFPLALIILIWINDTMQYIVGSIFGKNKMAPIISPKKTWEGTIGGSTLCLITAIILSIFFTNFTNVQWVAMGLIASVGGTLGDLLESKLKRSANIKDSGNIMPGHGGILDRFDSLFLASLLLWIFIWFCK